MLASACFGDDARFAHTLGEQSLAEGIVDFVGASMSQIFALEVNLRTATMRTEALCVGQCGGAPNERSLELGELGPKLCIIFDGCIGIY
jgi:hypothetical protein